MRLKTNISATTNTQLPGVNIEHMPTKSANSGALHYIVDTTNYKLGPELNVEKEKELESIFIEILLMTSKYVPICCIYKLPCMHSEQSNGFF